jgi:MarR family multiple antibiotic resistance transcriptional regulator
MHEASAFFDHLVRCETRLYNVVSDQLSAAHGIGAGPFEFLRYLRDHPDSRVSDLATAFALGIGTTSKAVDRYEKNEWVTRRPNPSNRRSSILGLTEAGRRLVDDAEATFDAAISDRLDSALSKAEVKAILAALAKLRRSLEAANVGIPAG